MPRMSEPCTHPSHVLALRELKELAPGKYWHKCPGCGKQTLIRVPEKPDLSVPAHP